MNYARLPHWCSDIALCVTFFTRIPVPALSSAGRFADALWAAPLAGALVGAISGSVLIAGLAVGVPASIAAAFGLCASVVATGALHEDGLADVADGFGGGRTRDSALEIMRDSRIGSYGALALVFSVLIRWSALAVIADQGNLGLIILSTVAAHAASRSLLPLFISQVPSARKEGLSARIGAIPQAPTVTALFLGVGGLLLLGPSYAVTSVIVLGVIFLVVRRLCIRKIGGQTGDVLGTLQQAAEIALLTTASIHS